MTETETKEAKEGKSLQNLAADFAALRDDFAKLSGSVRELLQTQASSTTHHVIDAVDDARRTLTDEMAGAKDRLETRLSTVTTDLESAIEHNPLVAVMIGAAVGFVVGLVSRPHK